MHRLARITRPRTITAAVLLLFLGLTGGIQAQQPPDWEPLPLAGPVEKLFAPSSGAFLALTGTGLHRSDDGGLTWRGLTLPPGSTAEALVDPTNHDVLYADGSQGLYKSTDGAASWSLVLPIAEMIQGIAVSPADPRVVLLSVGRGPYADHRSRDGGASWEVVSQPSASQDPVSLCNWQHRLYQAHETDPQRFFESSGCFAGRNQSGPLIHSRDQGTTWRSLFTPPTSFPERIVGGRGPLPGRLYLATVENRPPGSAWLYRSDDDGATWAEVLMVQGVASSSGAGAASINGLAYDPADSGRVFVGLAGPDAGVRMSGDAGATWSPLGQRGTGDVNDLVLGVDGRSLFAATDGGLWRLRLDGTPASPPPSASNFCAPGQQPHYVFGFARLKELLGDEMGDPLTCETPDPRGTGDVHQMTARGLAFWRKSTNTPTFTNGWDHWGLTADGFVYWTGESIDPPGVVGAAGPPPRPSSPPPGDYGDAPDGGPTGYPLPFAQTGTFPTLFASGGPYTLDVSEATLGPTGTIELDALDPSDPDGIPNLVNADLDDGIVGLGIVLTSIPPPATLAVQVHGGTGGQFYLNVLVDLDMDGSWGGTASNGEPEWVVQNHVVVVGAGEVQRVSPPPFAFGNGNRIPDVAWMRVALTSEPVTVADWSGTGEFRSGEIQDHQVNRADVTPPGPGPRQPGDPAGPNGEYGDAPDGGPTGYPGPFAQTGQFPTLASSGGAHTLAISGATLGPSASMEVDADDPADPDGPINLINADSDDGVVGLTSILVGIPPPAVLSVQVLGGSGGRYFLNVLIDLDMDGTWGGLASGGEPEWVVQNHPVTVGAGEAVTVTPPAFAFGNGNRLPDGAWMRVALTSEPVATADWDGTGTFNSGEIEDHVVTLPDVGGKRIPVLTLRCDSGGHYTFAPGETVIAFTCTVTNWGAAGSYTFVLRGPLTGAVTVTPLTGGGAIGPPGAPNSSVVLPFVATRGLVPSTWRLIVTAVDPPSVVTAGGVSLGFGDTEMTLEFTDEVGVEAALLEFNVVHGDGMSEIQVFGTGFQPNLVMTVRNSGPGVLRESVMVTTDPDGNFTTSLPIDRFGRYEISVDGVTRTIDVQ